MPGYPAFIAICGGKVQIVRAAQALLDASSVAAVFLIGRRLKGNAVALMGATLVAFHPYLIYFSGTLLSETLFTAVAAWGIYFLLRTPARFRFYGVALLVLSVYVRPSAIGMGIAAAATAYSFAPTWRKAFLGNAVAGIAAAIGLVIILTPWMIRNRVQLGHAIWTTTNSGFTAYDSFNPLADGSSNQDALFDVSALAPALATEGRAAPAGGFNRGMWFVTAIRLRGEVGRSNFYQHAAWDYARTHPRRVTALAFAKLGRFWSPVPLSADFGGRWLYVVVGGLYVVPLFVFAAIGTFRGGLGRRATLILLLPAIYFSAVHCVFVGSLRYRVPCDVPLAVLAAAGVMSFVRPKASTPPVVAA
ncbi:MAG: hypothetical protein JWM57_2875 [Phycisphaerales bacterium]|nr:hypothetical protein [Phycisphaerales bacterium]